MNTEANTTELKITGTATLPRWRTYDIDLTVGLSLRDLFAAFALAGIAQGSLQDREPASQRAAEHAYKYADAMLAQRNQTK